MKYESWSVSNTHSACHPSHHRKRVLSPSLVPGSCSWRSWRRPNWRKPWSRKSGHLPAANPRFCWGGKLLHLSSEPFVSLLDGDQKTKGWWLTQGAGSRWFGTRQVLWLLCSCSWQSPRVVVVIGGMVDHDEGHDVSGIMWCLILLMLNVYV